MKRRDKQVQQAQWSYVNDILSIKYNHELHKYFFNPLWALVSGGILKAAGWDFWGIDEAKVKLASPVEWHKDCGCFWTWPGLKIVCPGEVT